MKLMMIISLLIISLTSCKAESQPDNLGENLKAGFDVNGDSIVVNSYTPGTWITDYSAALAFAKSENKYILINFTGSDWCGWCKKLVGEVFSKPAFETYAKQNLVLVKLDFPRAIPQSAEEKAQNETLAKQYQVSGFPTIFLLDSDGKTIGQTGYQPGGPEAYIQHLKSFMK